MLRNYLLVAVRTLWAQRGYALLNVAGLAVGMACCLLIVLFLQEEVRYDRYHDGADALYRVTTDLKLPGAAFELATSMGPLGPALVAEMPEVTAATRVPRARERLVAYDDRRFYEEAFFFAEASLFDVFTYPFLRGNPATALAEPYTVVLTEATARKYFGGADPVGQVLRVDDVFDFTVTGVLAAPPGPTHFRFDFLASFASEAAMGLGDELDQWSSITGLYTYVVIPEGVAAVEARLPAFLETHLDAEGRAAITLHLQPVTDIRLHSDLSNEDADVGSLAALRTFAVIALLILLIAAINFINLSTARAVQRAREVGIRKALGAARGQLVRQFLGESVLLAVVALVVALVLVELLLPLFNELLQKDLAARYVENGLLLGALAGVTAFVGVVAGSYPAFVLSAFRPVEVLKGAARQRVTGALFRRILVVMQFTIAIALIIGSAVMGAQLAYVAEKDLGFDSEQVVVVPLREAVRPEQVEPFKRALEQHPSVVRTTAASFLPGMNSNSVSTNRPEGAAEDDAVGLRTLFLDPDAPATLGITPVAGRGFSWDVPTDTSAALLLNQAAARMLGWDDPLGKTLSVDERAMQVVGVLPDVHYSSLQEEIQPIVFRFAPDVFRYVAVRIEPSDVPATLAELRQTWRTFAPSYPFEYKFLDDYFAESYEASRRLSRTIRVFTLLAIFVACLGLFGLAAYTAAQRTREIGIRKVLGATVPGIVVLLAREFLLLVGLAFVVAAPVAYLAAHRWLDDFAYRVEIGAGVFLGAGALVLVVALVTVSYQSVRAALADPVESLRYE